MPGRNGLQREGQLGRIADQSDLVWRGRHHSKGLLKGFPACGAKLGDLAGLPLGGEGDVIHDTIWVAVNDPVPRCGKFIEGNPVISAQVLIGPSLGDGRADEGFLP